MKEREDVNEERNDEWREKIKKKNGRNTSEGITRGMRQKKKRKNQNQSGSKKRICNIYRLIAI